MLQSINAYTPDIHGNVCTESTNSMYILTTCTLYLVQQSVSVPPPESGLALSDQHLYSEGRLYHLHRVQALVRDKGKRNSFTHNYLCCNPIFLKIYQSYWGFSGNNLYLLPEHLILGIQTASYNLPYKHEVLKKKKAVLKIKILRYL